MKLSWNALHNVQHTTAFCLKDSYFDNFFWLVRSQLFHLSMFLFFISSVAQQMNSRKENDNSQGRQTAKNESGE